MSVIKVVHVLDHTSMKPSSQDSAKIFSASLIILACENSFLQINSSAITAVIDKIYNQSLLCKHDKIGQSYTQTNMEMQAASFNYSQED